jgi:hypothetical protein
MTQQCNFPLQRERMFPIEIHKGAILTGRFGQKLRCRWETLRTIAHSLPYTRVQLGRTFNYTMSVVYEAPDRQNSWWLKALRNFRFSLQSRDTTFI